MQPGDVVWVPVTVSAVLGDEVRWRSGPDCNSIGGQTSVDRVLPDSPALPIIAAWLQEQGDDAVDVLVSILDDAAAYAERDAAIWDGIRTERVDRDRRCAAAARQLENELFPLIPQPTEEERKAMMSEWEERVYQDYPHLRPTEGE